MTFFTPAKEFVVENNEPEFSFLRSANNNNTEDSQIIIFAVGDIMLDRGVEHKINKQGKGNFKFPFLKIAEDLKKADILFGNLEGTISDKGKKVGSIYSFRANPKAMNGLVFAGFDILSLANNHMLDYQKFALEDTMHRLKENNIDYVGAGFNKTEAFSLKIKEVKNTKIGFLAYTDLGPKIWQAGENNSGIAWITEQDIEKIKKDISAAKQKTDVLIISLHSGEEYLPDASHFQISFSKACIDAGADLIIGHHPHVIQKTEKYKNAWIAYSLGNFIFDQSFSQETMQGLLLKIIIKDKAITKIIPQEIKISNLFQPYFVENYYLKNFINETKGKFISKKKNFLEVNLREMKVKVYDRGFLKKEFPILTAGDPGFWAGTPAGLYSVISKQELAFSSIADVYMPWLISFYGKYCIHGEPYYSDKQKSDFDYTGGCIRLLDNIAEELYKLTENQMPILITSPVQEEKYPVKQEQIYVFDGAGQEIKRYHNENFSTIELIPEVSAESYLVADLDTGFVFTQRKPLLKLPIADLTKLMTAIVLSENIDLRKSVLVKQEMLESYDSVKELTVGRKFNLVELFYPLLVESSDNSARILESFLGARRTVKLMNEKAKIFGMENTHFSDIAGESEKNLSTSQDIFYLAQYLLHIRPPILRITKGEEVENFGGIRFEDLQNKNIFFDRENFIGGKTGYTSDKKEVGLFIFEFNIQNKKTNILIVILGSENVKKDADLILKWLNQRFAEI